MSKSFVDGVKTPFAQSVSSYTIDTKEGPKTFSYLAWALALALAERPAQEIVESEGAMFLSVFGGCVVGVRQKVGDTGPEQITWLPVLNGANQAMPEARVTSRDVSDTINRCRAKAVAMVNGVGLSLYARGDNKANTLAFIKALKVTPNDDLSTLEPFITTSEEKNGTYIDWPHAIAAARITDPNFAWEVVFKEAVDKTTGAVASKPYFRLGTGYGVAVKATYKGVTHTEILPIMGFAEVQTKNGPKQLDHQPLANPNCHDWNRSVMRCLVKAIAVVSGYGLNLYAKADVEALSVEPLQRKDASAEQVPAAAAVDDDDPKVKAELVARVNIALKQHNRDVAGVLSWLGHKDTADLTVCSIPELEKALAALTAPRRIA